MTTTYVDSAYCAAKVGVLRCPPRSQIGFAERIPRDHQPNPVHLVPCDRPVGQLESAPRTSLSGPGAAAELDGFWGTDERYYARSSGADGSERWFRVADAAVVSRKKRESRVLPLRPRGGSVAVHSRRLVVLGSSRSGRTILVGHSRKRREDPAAHDAGER